MAKLPLPLQQFIKYAIVGASSATIDIGLLNLFLYWHWPILPANTIAFIIAVINSYFLNKYWTYQDRTRNWKTQLPFYIIIYGVGLAVSNGSIYWLSILLHWDVNMVKIMSMIAIIAWNFLAPRFFIFKPKTT